MIVDCPINNLSLGNVSLNILRELIKRKKINAIFPVGDSAEFSAFDNLDGDIRAKIIDLANNRIIKQNRKDPTLKIWHLSGSEKKLSDNQYLFTFYELDSPTMEEIMIASQQTKVFVSSSESQEQFRRVGLDNFVYIPLGFDTDFHKTEREYLGEDVIHFGICGKWEKRKNTDKVIRLWLKMFGNNPKYQLSCLVDNPFFKKEIMDQIKLQTLDGQHYTNINFLPHLQKNSEVNDFINSIDIDLSGCCANESWNLPSFNAACLGKICLVGMGHGHKDWADGENIIKLKTNGTQPCYDGAFFNQGQKFNQGSFYVIDDEEILDGFEKALKLKENYKEEERKDLQEKFSYKNTVDKILEEIKL